MKFSISQIKQFKACRRSYFFKYIEELEPVQKAEPLQIGSNYHSLIERLYTEGDLDIEGDYSKERAMAIAYGKYIYPKLKLKKVEESFEYPLNGMDSLIGRVDGVAEDGMLVEHKTTSSEISPQYEYNLMWDEQILAYMLAYGVRNMYYTVCRKPTIRLKKGETEEEFFERMIEWYGEDTEKKIALIMIERTDEEVENFKRSLDEIISTIEHADAEKNYYKNCLWCNVWGRRCEYSSICLNYDPNETYIEFEKVERRKEDGIEEITG